MRTPSFLFENPQVNGTEIFTRKLEEGLCEEPEEPGEPGDPGDSGNPPPACLPDEVLGAAVDFLDGEDVVIATVFVAGNSADAVNNSADSMLFGPEGWEGHTPVTDFDLECR